MNPIRVSIVGAGYVGLVTAVAMAARGCRVTLIDRDTDRLASIRRGRAPFYEPGLDDQLVRLLAGARLVIAHADQAGDHYRGSDATVICVGTPEGDNGQQDATMLMAAVIAWANATDGEGLLVVKSTVAPGTCDRIAGMLPRATVLHMPEFLAEGTALEGALKPDRIVVGRSAIATLSREYNNAVRYVGGAGPGIPIFGMDLISAEMTKYASNFMLASRLSAINEVGGICEAVGADVFAVSEAVGADPRIGEQYLRPGIGWGGSCFPKDTAALVALADDHGLPAHMVRATIEANGMARQWLISKLDDMLEGGEIVAVWGVAFKPGTSDTRDSPALDVLEWLNKCEEASAIDELRVHDPQAKWGRMSDKALDAVRGADVLVVCTEWPEYCQIDPAIVAKVMRGRVVLDGRGVWNMQAARSAGLDYHIPGRP